MASTGARVPCRNCVGTGLLHPMRTEQLCSNFPPVNSLQALKNERHVCPWQCNGSPVSRHVSACLRSHCHMLHCKSVGEIVHCSGLAIHDCTCMVTIIEQLSSRAKHACGTQPQLYLVPQWYAECTKSTALAALAMSATHAGAHGHSLVGHKENELHG